MPINTIDGVDLYYEFYPKPEKPTIVLIHGFLSSTFSFRRLIPYIMNDFNVIALDFPPFGQSGKSKVIIYTYKNIAALIIKLLHELKVQNITLVGHSMGGQICLHIAKQKPTLVKKVVLLSCSGYLKRSKKSLIAASYLPLFHLYVKFWLNRQGLKKTLLHVVYDHRMIDDEMMNGYLDPFLNKQIFIGLTKMIRDREGDLSSEELQQIQTPCQLILGEEDKVVPIHIGKRLHQDLPNSTFHSIPNAGHLIPEEKPEIVYNLIMEG